MVDDDVSTLLKLDEKGFHAGGTVQAGSRPLFVASGGFTVNPPDLASAGDKLRSLLEHTREAIADVAHDLPDPSPTMGDAIDALRHAAPDLRASAAGLAGAIPGALPSAPDADRLAADARDLAVRARHAVGLAPTAPTLLERMPRWLPGGLLAVASIAVAGAVIVLFDPVHGADRRRRLRDRLDDLLGRSPAELREPEDSAPRNLIPVPIEPGAGTPIVGATVAR